MVECEWKELCGLIPKRSRKIGDRETEEEVKDVGAF